MVCGKGVNDMPRGWTKTDEWNYRVYQLWKSMIQRCYDEKYHEKYPTYIGCTVCKRWLKLGNFVEDIKLIENYELWLSGFGEKINPYQLDKDIKSNGTNKCYCLENCCFTTIEENCKQANKTRDNTYLQGENHPRATLVDRFSLDGIYIDTKYQFEYVRMGFNSGHIYSCCKGKRKTHKGFIFKYHNK